MKFGEVIGVGHKINGDYYGWYRIVDTFNTDEKRIKDYKKHNENKNENNNLIRSVR